MQEELPLISYKWDFATAVENMPALRELTSRQNELKRVSNNLAQALHKLLKDLKREVKIKVGKRQNLLNKSVKELKKSHPDTLTGTIF